MPSRTRAIALTAPESFEAVEVEVRDPGPSDVVLRPTAVGVCGTDFHIATGEANYNLDASGEPIPLDVQPQVLGHEIVAEVLEAGSEVTDLARGDRLVLDQGLNCLSLSPDEPCEYCATGFSHQCENYIEYGITGLAGGFSEQLVAPAVNSIAIRSDTDAAECAMTEPLACILHMASLLEAANQRYRINDPEERDRVRTALITGAGPAGLLMVQVLRKLVGFDGQLLLSEPDARKRALAERFGATVHDPADSPLHPFVEEATGGRMLELALDASGSGRAFVQVPALLRKQATVVKYGIGFHGEGLERLNEFQWKEPTFIMPVGASSPFDDDGRATRYRAALRAIEDGTIDVASIVSHRYSGLDSVPQAFGGDQHEAGYVKGIVVS